MVRNLFCLRYVKRKFNLRYFCEKGNTELPEAPTTCCMSGCANCVWIEYAEKLVKLLQDGDKTKNLILEKVEDPNMRAFLLTELSTLKVNPDPSDSNK